MKIGIITFNFVYNYGAVVQAWALRKYLTNLGHDVRVVNYNPKLSRKPWWIQDFCVGMKRICKGVMFHLFRFRYLNETRKIKGVESLSSLHFDAYVVGSDQVWNVRYFTEEGGRYNGIYFLSGTLGGARRVAYAASIGDAAWEEYRWKSDLLDDIRKFNAISVREEVARNELGKFGIGSVLVPDPVFLSDVNDYEALIGIDKSPVKYVFGYLLTEYEEGLSCLKRLGKRLGLPTRVLALAHEELSTELLSPKGWLRRIRDASFFITDSFHGTAFALLFRVPFAVILKPNRNAMNARVVELLKRVGLENRIVEKMEDIDAMCGSHIDWGKVHLALNEYTECGRRFISGALA